MNKTVVVLCFTAIAVAIIGLIGWVSYTGGDVERILGWAGTILGPMVAALASVLAVRSVHESVNEAKKDIRIVKVQTNGKMKQFGDRLDVLEKTETGGTD